MKNTAIIGGTGLTSIKTLEIVRREVFQTPYGEPSGPLTFGKLGGTDVVFLARHGYGHTIPPHKVNFRANIWALKSAGVENIIAVAAVGGIHNDLSPTRIAFPDQIIDYTSSRGNTYFEDCQTEVTHIDFTYPYCTELRARLIKAAKAINLDYIENGTYGATQGPRLETAAEVKRMARDGCDMVGMTGMPEAALARELNLCYATCAVVANYAAGKSPGIIEMSEIDKNVKQGMEKVRALLEYVLTGQG